MAETLWLKVALFAILGAASAIAANRRLSFFHDGLRPMVPQLLTGALTREEFARTAYRMSIGFIVLFSAPLTLISGVIVAHTVFLAADIVGAWAPSRSTAGLAGGVSSGLIVLVLDLLRYGLAVLPNHPLTALAHIGDLYVAVYFLGPAAVAIRFLGPRKGGLVLGATLIARWLANPLNAAPRAGLWLSAEAVAAMVGITGLVYFVTRRRNEGPDPLAEFSAQSVARLRQAVVPLGIAAAAAAALANLGWFAGDPATALVLGQGRLVDAALIALLSIFSFGPLTVNSAKLVGAYTHQGLPEVVQAVGYVMPNPLAAAVVGSVLMTAQLLGFGRLADIYHRYPDLNELADAMRGGSGFGDIALTFGGLVAAQTLWPIGGPVLVIAAYLVNDLLGKPMIRMVIAPYTAILAGVIGAFVK